MPVAAPPAASAQAAIVQPAPQSKSFPGKKDVFQAAEYDPAVAAAYPGAQRIQLRVGEVIPVYQGSASPANRGPELAFHVPIEGTSIVQVVVESNGFTRSYFLKGIGRGETVGGVVERRWLDDSGFQPLNVAMQGRIQNAIKTQPYLILVQ